MEEPRSPAPAFSPLRRVRALHLLLLLAMLFLSAPWVVRAQEPPTPARLWISEVMVDPVAIDDLGEWVEIANLGGTPVELVGWQVRTAQGRMLALPAQTRLEPGSYGVLAERGSALLHVPIPIAGLVDLWGLAVQDGLALIAPDGTIVDEVYWGDDPAVQPGYSLERTGPAPDAWVVAATPLYAGSTEWGSPGLPWQPPPTPTPAPSVRISEVMADPAAVYDDAGEWVEVWNPNSFPVDLAGWQLADSRESRFTIGAVTIGPGSYVILGRHTDPALNGGLHPDALFTTIQLANQGDSLRLLAPDGSLIDHLAWDAALCVSGHSIERTDSGLRSAVLPWPGSLGDWGSPHAAAPPAPPATFTPTPTPTLSPTPTLPPTPTLSPTPTDSPPTPTVTPVPLPGLWLAPQGESPLQFDEVGYRGEAAYLVLMNTSAQPLDLHGWSVGDSARPVDGEGMVLLPDLRVPAGGAFLLAQDGAAFLRRWMVAPDAQVRAGDPGVPTLQPLPGFHSSDFSLSDSGDELVLIAPDGRLADALIFGDGDGAALGIEGSVRAGEGMALVRLESVRWPAVRDIRHRFTIAPEDPLLRRAISAPTPHVPLPLADGLFAWWGGLGTESTFSPGGTLPPLAALAEAAAEGLDFLALTDPYPHAALPLVPPITLLPAWRWEGDGDRAILYGIGRRELADRWALLPVLEATDSSIQWLRGDWLPHRTARLLSTDWMNSAQDAPALVARWRAAGGPLLPAGNSPALPFGAGGPPRYTGLAAHDASPEALLAALRARRGWMTSAPGLALALVAQTESGSIWMGSALPPANQLALRIHAQDRSGQPLSITLWQDERALATWEALPGAPPHALDLFGEPDTYLYATATRVDGAFAVSAPLYVRPNALGRVVIAEVLADPTSDLNGDGRADDSDEFVELLNAGELPVSLEGWQLFDSRGAISGQGRHIFAPGETIPAQGRLVLWRSETGLALNNGAERLHLFMPGGGEADEVGWDELDTGRAAARAADGSWLYGVAPTPGEATGPPSAESAALLALPAPNALQSSVSASPPGADIEAALEIPALPALPAAPAASSVDASPAAAAPAGPDTVTLARRRGIAVETVVRGVITLEPDKLHSLIYIAEPAVDGLSAGAGLRIYLPLGDFPALREGDWVEARGLLQSYRGERELRPAGPAGILRLEAGAPLLPQPISLAQVGEPFEGRLVRLEGIIDGQDGDSLFLRDPAVPELPPVRIIVARSLGWPPPVAAPGELWQVTGIVGQHARASPWNGDYRIWVRAPADLVRLR